ncbi:MAG: EFR1 family ferrodoxin [Clostridium sp.]
MKIFYFTSTGNSYYVGKRIIETLGHGELINISKVDTKNTLEINEDCIGIIYPIHCGSLPILMEKFLKEIKIINNPYIFLIGVTGGGGASFSFPHVEKLINKEVSNSFTLKYISNYIRAGRNPSRERAEEAIRRNEPIIKELCESIKNREIKRVKRSFSVEGLMYNAWKNLYKNRDKAFNVNNNCISCGICKKVCGAKNIELVNGKPVWSGKCTDCMACINLCPKNAINIGNKTIKKERYMNLEVKIEELL